MPPTKTVFFDFVPSSMVYNDLWIGCGEGGEEEDEGLGQVSESQYATTLPHDDDDA
jgi:hypothetical protein